jgi:hypothetical protein
LKRASRRRQRLNPPFDQLIALPSSEIVAVSIPFSHFEALAWLASMISPSESLSHSFRNFRAPADSVIFAVFVCTRRGLGITSTKFLYKSMLLRTFQLRIPELRASKQIKAHPTKIATAANMPLPVAELGGIRTSLLQEI